MENRLDEMSPFISYGGDSENKNPNAYYIAIIYAVIITGVVIYLAVTLKSKECFVSSNNKQKYLTFERVKP